jgi:hypothetical protein
MERETQTMVRDVQQNAELTLAVINGHRKTGVYEEVATRLLIDL